MRGRSQFAPQRAGLALLLAAGLATTVGCRTGSSPVIDGSWSASQQGLQVRLEVPEPMPQEGEVQIKLRFRNAGPQPLRIYLIETDVFRAGQSTFTLRGDAPTPLDVQPEPHPHGYVVTEKDFHLIPPGKERTFRQSLRLPASAREQRQLTLEWTYENRVTRWPGGVLTLDGPTRALFDGKDIPFIWTGQLRAIAVLRGTPAG